MSGTGPLDTPRDWVVVWAYDMDHKQGPHIDRLERWTYREMVRLMARWAASRCMPVDGVLWVRTRRGWQPA